MVFKDLTGTESQDIHITKANDYVFFLWNSSGTFNLHLECPEAQVYFYGIFLGQSDEIYDLKIIQNHLAKRTTSNVFVKGVFDDHSHFKYNGLIKIDQHSAKSEAFQSNQNLLLSDDVSITSSPSLEILNNNIKCSHSASTSKPSNEILNYLSARGLSQDESLKIYTLGFLKKPFLEIKEKVKKLSPELEPEISNILKKYQKKLQSNH